MWKNYGMTFIEYLFLNKFRKNNSHMNIKNEKLLIEINKQKNQLSLFLVILQILN